MIIPINKQTSILVIATIVTKIISIFFNLLPKQGIFEYLSFGVIGLQYLGAGFILLYLASFASQVLNYQKLNLFFYLLIGLLFAQLVFPLVVTRFIDFDKISWYYSFFSLCSFICYVFIIINSYGIKKENYKNLYIAYGFVLIGQMILSTLVQVLLNVLFNVSDFMLYNSLVIGLVNSLYFIPIILIVNRYLKDPKNEYTNYEKSESVLDTDY